MIVLCYQLSILQFDSILTLNGVSEDPTGEGLSPTRLPSPRTSHKSQGVTCAINRDSSAPPSQVCLFARTAHSAQRTLLMMKKADETGDEAHRRGLGGSPVRGCLCGVGVHHLPSTRRGSPARKLSRRHTFEICTEASSRRHQSLTIANLSPLPRKWGWGAGLKNPYS